MAPLRKLLCPSPHIIAILACALIFVSTGTSYAAPPPTDRFIIHPENEDFQTKIYVLASDGCVAWSDVARALARNYGLDDSAVSTCLPLGSMNLTRRRNQTAISMFNKTMSPCMHMHVVRSSRDKNAWALKIVLDRKGRTEYRRDIKDAVRDRVANLGGARAKAYQLKFDSGWEKLPKSRELVVLVHGFNSGPTYMEDLAVPIRAAGHPCALLAYPNDQALDDSANLLARQLGQLARKYPQRRVAVVAHSMGGLIARDCIEDRALNPGNVRRLIMIAPPTHGSLWAKFACGTDLHEHVWDAPLKTSPTARFFASFEDGLAEAHHDLKPNSPYLRELARRNRNPDVRYSIFLGTKAPLTREKLNGIREQVQRSAQKSRVAQLFAPKTKRFIDEMDEVVSGHGDGVVAVRRGRLEGVDDTVLLPFDHWMSNSEAVRRLYAEIIARLKST